MQFEDPRSILESAAAKPERELDAPALMSRGRRMRRIRYAALAAGLAVTVTGASASIAVMRADEREDRPGPVAGDCPADDTECLSRAAFCFEPAPLKASVYLHDDAPEDEFLELRDALLGMRGVGRLEYFSKEDAYEEFAALYEDQPELWENLSADALPASFRVAVSNEETLRRIHELESPIIDETRSSLDVRERLCGGEAVPGPNVDIHRDVERHEPTQPAARGDATLLDAECGAGPTHATRTHFLESPEQKWCRFDVRIANLGGSPIRFPYADQLLHIDDTAVPPWSSADGGNAPFFARPLFRNEIRPAAAAYGELVFVMAHDEVPKKLELWGSSRNSPIVFTLDYDCLTDLRDDRDGVCSLAGELRDPAYGIEEGPAEVTLYHCGVDPVLFAGRQWVVTSPPFDATNAPEDFTGRGRFEVRSGRAAVYVDESGERLHFEAMERWTPPPCA